MNWFIGVATVFVAAVGLWLTNSYRRQVTLKLSQTRLEAYSRLWEITGFGAPTRLEGWGDDGYLRLEERRDLWTAMTDWYYANGGGMLLTSTTRNVFLNVRHDLVCESSALHPPGLDDQIKRCLPTGQELDDKVRGTLAIRLVSLLRIQLKSDLAIYGSDYSGRLNEYERFFLKHSNVKLRSRAWQPQLRGTPGCGGCRDCHQSRRSRRGRIHRSRACRNPARCWECKRSRVWEEYPERHHPHAWR